jgi:adenosylcobinamide-GDP ribazoletransferase
VRAPLAALFAVLALALLTGGFHLDGLADTCDGVFSARTRERMLEIMRDSRLGTHGGLALVFVLVAKILVISELSCVVLRFRRRWPRPVPPGAVARW